MPTPNSAVQLQSQPESKRCNSLHDMCCDYPAATNAFHLKELQWYGFKKHHFENGATKAIDPLITHTDRLIHGIAGKTVLELGPFEAAHTINLNEFSPASTLSIEANPFNYVKCLVVKQQFRLDQSQFLLGDFVQFLQTDKTNFDLILSAGVLYHLSRPFFALDLMLERTSAVAICTTVYKEGDCPFRMTGQTRQVELPGEQPITLHERFNVQKTQGKKHGIDKNAWLFTEADLLRFLRSRGWSYEVIPYTRHANSGPRVRLLAQKLQSKPIADRESGSQILPFKSPS